MQKKKNTTRDTQKDMVTSSQHNNIDTIKSIILGKENDIQDDFVW